MQAKPYDKRWRDICGFIPDFLLSSPELPAKAAIDENYQHGGGWRSFDGFIFDPNTRKISYLGDPPYSPIVEFIRGDEVVIIYEYAWVLILQPDGSHEIARID